VRGESYPKLSVARRPPARPRFVACAGRCVDCCEDCCCRWADEVNGCKLGTELDTFGVEVVRGEAEREVGEVVEGNEEREPEEREEREEALVRDLGGAVVARRGDAVREGSAGFSARASSSLTSR
jgi:hypothetical protein